MVILTILILPIRELNISLYLSVSSSVSFIDVLYCYMYRFFTSLVKFIPRYFIRFEWDCFLNFYFWWFIPIQAAVFIMDDTAFGLQCAKYLFFLMTKHLTKRVIRHSFYRRININLLKTIWFNGLIFSWKCQVYWKTTWIDA